MNNDGTMPLHEAIAGIMVRHGFMATRPTGLKLVLNRAGKVYMRGRLHIEPARFSCSDILAEDWRIEAVPTETPAVDTIEE